MTRPCGVVAFPRHTAAKITSLRHGLCSGKYLQLRRVMGTNWLQNSSL